MSWNSKRRHAKRYLHWKTREALFEAVVDAAGIDGVTVPRDFETLSL